MTTCEEMRNRLLLRQSGEYIEGSDGPLRAHLATCDECRRFAVDLDLLAALAPAALACDAPVSIRRIPAPACAPVSIRLLRLVRPWAAAAAVALVVLGVLLFRPKSSSSSSLEDTPPLPHAALASRDALVREWRYWVMVGLGHDEAMAWAVSTAENGGSPAEMAQQLLLFEGLGPDAEWGVETLFWIEQPAPAPHDARAIGSSSHTVV